MKTVCCVCGAKIKDNGVDDGLVSHGYCEACLKVVMLDIKVLIEKTRGIDRAVDIKDQEDEFLKLINKC